MIDVTLQSCTNAETTQRSNYPHSNILQSHCGASAVKQPTTAFCGRRKITRKWDLNLREELALRSHSMRSRITMYEITHTANPYTGAVAAECLSGKYAYSLSLPVIIAEDWQQVDWNSWIILLRNPQKTGNPRNPLKLLSNLVSVQGRPLTAGRF
ncbi:hypothetical protein BKA93DRAFT_53773 [Sparassis latifolia]